MFGLKFLKTQAQLLFLLDSKILSVHCVKEKLGFYYAILYKDYKL